MINTKSVELDLKKMGDIRDVIEEANMLIDTEEEQIKAKVEEDKEVQRDILKLQQRSMAIQADIKKMNEAKPAKIAKIEANKQREIGEINDCDKANKATLNAIKAERVEAVVHFQLEGQAIAQIDIPNQIAELISILKHPCVAGDNAHQQSIKEDITSLEALVSGIKTNAVNILTDCQSLPCSTLRKLFDIYTVKDIESLPVRQEANTDNGSSFNAVEPIIAYLRDKHFANHPHYISLWAEDKDFKQFVYDSRIPASWQHALPPSINKLNKPNWHRFLCFILDISEDDE